MNNLLIQLLNAIPSELDIRKHYDGYPLTSTTVWPGLFSHIFLQLKQRNAQGWYFSTAAGFFVHPYIHILLPKRKRNIAS